jgi:hypothetical protein
LPATSLHGGARRAEALNGGRPNEGRGTPLSRSARSSGCGGGNRGASGLDGETERAITGGAHNTWSRLALSRGAMLAGSGDLELDGDDWFQHRRKEATHGSGVTPSFKAKTRCSSCVCLGSSCHTYDQNVSTENQCLYYIISYYKNLLQVQKKLNNGMDTILTQTVDQGFRTHRRGLHQSTPHLLSSRA